ncbi:MAG: superoxide dismutase [Sphingomonadales bacterium]|nr:superoxide dismutase [Sphingomonadales bacterium]MDE2172140.1 superoxide dismutase [Sphingomonadales bacterium]
MSDLSRCDAIGSLALSIPAAATIPAAASAQTAAISITPAFGGEHPSQPLGFDTTKLAGLSEELVRSHRENNHQGSVKALNMVEGRLAAAMTDKDLPPVIYGDLKRDELQRTGSAILLELYFEQLGGDGQAKGAIRDALTRSHGSFETWEAEFRRTAMALAGGSGWCILAWNQYTKSLHNYWAWGHTNGPVAGTPCLVLDMYEHAFAIDYGAAAAKYVEAFMHNIHWAVVDARYRAAIMG